MGLGLTLCNTWTAALNGKLKLQSAAAFSEELMAEVPLSPSTACPPFPAFSSGTAASVTVPLLGEPAAQGSRFAALQVVLLTRSLALMQHLVSLFAYLRVPATGAVCGGLGHTDSPSVADQGI